MASVGAGAPQGVWGAGRACFPEAGILVHTVSFGAGHAELLLPGHRAEGTHRAQWLQMGSAERGLFPFTFVVFRFKMKLSHIKKTPTFFYSTASVHPLRGKHSHGGFFALCLSSCLRSALSERLPLANYPRTGFGASGFVSFFAIISNQFHSRFVVGIKASPALRSPGRILCLCVPADATPG